MKFTFTNKVLKQYFSLDKLIQNAIEGKLIDIKNNGGGDFKQLINFSPATHRLRIGDYRLILQLQEKGEYIVLKIAHRKEVYK